MHFMLMSVPMVHFVKNTLKFEKYKVLDVINLLFLCECVDSGNFKQMFENPYGPYAVRNTCALVHCSNNHCCFDDRRIPKNKR